MYQNYCFARHHWGKIVNTDLQKFTNSSLKKNSRLNSPEGSDVKTLFSKRLRPCRKRKQSAILWLYREIVLYQIMPFEVDHVMSCRHGGFHTLWHNEIRDLLAGLFREVCHDVSVQPCLQPRTGEQFPASTNKFDEACLDIRAKGFWGTGRGQQDAILNVRVFYPFASSYRNSCLPTLYRQHESQKRFHHRLRVREVERGCFTPLVFTTGGGMAPEATVCLKRLASMLSNKREEIYSTVMGLAQMCYLFLPAAIQPGMSPWVHQERQRPNTNY